MITLRNLTLADDGASFGYSYMDDGLNWEQSTKKLSVTPSRPSTTKTTTTTTTKKITTSLATKSAVIPTPGTGVKSENMLYIVIGLLVFLIGCVVVLIVVCCCCRRNERHNNNMLQVMVIPLLLWSSGDNLILSPTVGWGVGFCNAIYANLAYQVNSGSSSC